MLMRSISRTDAAPRANATARSRILAASRTRCSCVNRLESSTPAIARFSGGIITAQATTGPAIGPLPTSSTPARRGPFSRRNSRSMVVQRAHRNLRRFLFGVGLEGSGVDWGTPGSTSSCMVLYARCASKTLRLDASLGRGFGYRLRAGHGDLCFPLPDAGGLSSQVAQIIELGATHASAADDRDVCDHRTVHREDPLDTDAVGDLPDGEGRADPAAALGNADALKSLQPFLVTLAHANIDAERVSRAERRDVVAKPLFLGVDEGMHMTLGAGVTAW